MVSIQTTTMNHSRNNIHLMCSFSEYESLPQQKGVHFSSHSNIWLYSRDDFDPRSVWYTPSDYTRFKYDNSADAKRLRICCEKDLNENELTFWGLEILLQSGLKERISLARARVREGVLLEQMRQGEGRRCNPHTIAKSSIRHSRGFSQVAHKKALFYSSQLSCTSAVEVD